MARLSESGGWGRFWVCCFESAANDEDTSFWHSPHSIEGDGFGKRK